MRLEDALRVTRRSGGLHAPGSRRAADVELRSRRRVGGPTATMIGGNQVMTAVEQNTLKRRGVGMKAFDPERACPGFTLFAPLFVQSRTVYLLDLQGQVV